MRKLLLALVVLLAIATPVHAQGPALGLSEPGDPHNTLVICESGDRYAPLAQEIAATEGLTLFDAWPDALAAKPWTILWVAAPDTLDEERFAQVGLLLREYGPVSLGLISGSTQKDARELWLREPAEDGDLVSIVPREGVVDRHVDGAPVFSEPISSDAVAAALQEASVLSYQGHGTRSSWRVLEDEWQLHAANMHALNGPVVVAGACQTFKVWAEDSIAIAFADQGAVAYVGYLYSPQGYAFGEPKGFAEALTWPEFPLGMLVAAQNRGLGQGHMAWPYYFLLGDPRTSLAEGPAYTVVSDVVEGEKRTLTLSGLPDGPVPILVPGGAEYTHVKAQGGRRAWLRDPFYDADLQMIDVGQHKYMLLDTMGGRETLVLEKRVPFWVRIIEPLGDALDHTTLIQHTQGSVGPNLALTVLVWLVVGWRALRKRTRLTDNLASALAAGLALTVARSAYAYWRAPYLAHMYTGYLRTMDVDWAVSVLFLLSSFALTVGAVWLLLNARRWWGRLIAASLVVGPTSIMAAFWLAFSAGINLLAGQQYGASLYGYAMGTMMLIACAVEAALAGLVLVVARKRD